MYRINFTCLPEGSLHIRIILYFGTHGIPSPPPSLLPSIVTATLCHRQQRPPPSYIIVMKSPPPLDEFNFLSDFLQEADFGAAFDFSDDCGVDFGVAFSFDSTFGDSSISSGSFQYDNVEQNLQLCRRRHCRQCQPNQCFQIKSMKKSCWYQKFTKPGMTRDLTHELSSSDHFGKFSSWFCMPLVKVEVLTSTLINCGYIVLPRLHHCRTKFQEHSELLVMSGLHILASGALF
jgi:hypothetical protein